MAESTADDLWKRHILDSAQLLRVAPNTGTWADIGSGAGLPGIIVAILSGNPVTLIEPRRLRADFLRRVREELRLSDVHVITGKVERVEGQFDIITARAVAALDRLLGITVHLAHQRTVWVLPKGRRVQEELGEAQRSWHYDLRAEPSCTDADSSILLLSNVKAKRKP
nr:16S rRNA (guanine(527)-N(7))-methyltransferase RsmG [Sphingomonas piscis]